MTIREAVLDEKTLAVLIGFSEDWAAENSCFGYRPNEKSDMFGKVYPSKQMQSIMPEGTPYFEVEELYVVPERRSRGIGMKLFRYVEEAVKAEAEYMVLSTATKNWKAVFHFYLDELDMTFWSARLFKKIEK